MPYDLQSLRGVTLWLFTTVIASGFVGAIVQQISKWRFDRSLENYKSELNARNEHAIERLRADSNIATEKFKKSFGLLADRQAEVIESMYGYLIKAHLAFLQVTSPARFGGEAPDEDLFLTLNHARWDGYSYFRQKRLFLPPEMGSKLDQFYSKISSGELTMRFVGGEGHRRSKDWEKIGNLYDDANGPMADMLRDIEENFRKLLSGETI